MTMPVNLVLLRHGESEGNLANELSRNGDDSMFTEEFRNRHSSQWHLTAKGVEQAKVAGDWIRRNIMPRFDRYYVSEYFRAMETAAHSNFEEAEWRLEFFLRERDWGLLDVATHSERKGRYKKAFERRKRDGVLWNPLGGESMSLNCLYTDRTIQTLHRECSDKNVLMVFHGERMWTYRLRLERLSLARYRQLDESSDQRDKIHNCQVIHYTRRDPVGGKLSDHLSWMRSVCPWDESLSDPNWQRLDRLKYSNAELLEMTKS